ncbi:hypothetical protein D3C79_716470 [compost metagenome]
MPAVVLALIAILRAQPLVIHAQGGGELPPAQGRHVAEPDAGPVGAGTAEGLGLAGLGHPRLQAQLLHRPLVAGTLQLDAVAQLVGDGAGDEIPAHVQLAADPLFGEGGELPLAAVAGIAAQQVVLQQAALVGAVLGVVAIEAPGELIRQQTAEIARLPAKLAPLGALAALLVVLAHLPLAVGLGHFARSLIPLRIVLEVVELQAQQVVIA